MTITWRTATSTAATNDASAPYDSITYTLPTGHTTDDLLLCVLGLKPADSDPLPSVSGYTSCGSQVSASGQTFGSASEGDCHAMAWQKVDGGSESAPVVTFGDRYSPAIPAMLAAYSSNSGSGWTVAYTSGSDDDPAGTTVSATGGSLTWATGDHVVVVSVSNDETSTDVSPGLAIANCTVGSLTTQASQNTTAGTDGSMYVYTAEVTSGGTGAPTFTATNGVSGPTMPDQGPGSHRAVLFIKVTEPVSASVDYTPFTVHGQVNL